MRDDKEEDNKIKKTLANIAFSLLEKSFNRKTASRMFDGIKEALHHEKNYGGKIYVMDEVEMEISRDWKTIDVDFDDRCDWRIETDPEGDTYLVNKLNGDKPHKIYEYKIEDDKIHYVIKDDPDRGIEVIGKKNKYYIVSKTGERKMTNGLYAFCKWK